MADDPKNDFNSVTLKMLGFGSNIAVGMIFFFWLGTYLDNKFGTADQFTTYGVLLAIFYCGYQIYKVARETQK